MLKQTLQKTTKNSYFFDFWSHFLYPEVPLVLSIPPRGALQGAKRREISRADCSKTPPKAIAVSTFVFYRKSITSLLNFGAKSFRNDV